MKRLLFITILALSPFIVGWTLQWEPVTAYTDGKAIDDDTVVYDIWKDGTQVGSGLSVTSYVFESERGKTHTFTGKARLLRQGVSSVESIPFVWTCPPGTPEAPSKFQVVP